MKIRTQNILPALSAILVMLPFIYASVSLVSQQLSRWRMTQQLEKESLQTIQLRSDDDYHWIQQGHEMRVNGHLFEVKNFTETPGLLTITGIFDVSTDRINAEVADFFSNQCKQTNNIHSFQALLSFSFVEMTGERFSFSDIIPDDNEYNFFKTYGLPAISAENATPPPRFS